MPNLDGTLTPDEQAAADRFNAQGLPQATPVDTLSPQEQQTVNAFNAAVPGGTTAPSLHPQQPAVIPPLYAPTTPAAPPANADRAAAPAGQDLPLQPLPQPVPPAGPAPIERTGRVSTTETDRKIITPAEKALQAEVDNTAQDRVDLAQRQTPIDVANAKAEAEAADAKAAQAAQQQLQIKSALDQGQAYYDQRMARYQQLEQEHQGKQLHSFFDDPKNGSRVVAGIAAFLSPQAIPIIQDRMNRDFELQKANIEKSRQDLERAKGDVELARQFKADRLADLNLKFAAANDSAAALLAQALKKNGVPEAQIQGDARVLDFKKQAEAAKQKWFDDTRNTTRNVVQTSYAQTTGKPGTDGDGKGGLGAVRQNQVFSAIEGGKQAIAEINALEAKGVRLTPEDWNKRQQNKEQADAAHKRSESGVGGALATWATRGLGITPRNDLDGFSPEKQHLFNLYDKVITHGQELQPGQSAEVKKQYADRYSGSPGLDARALRAREADLKKNFADLSAIQDSRNVGERRVAAADGVAAADSVRQWNEAAAWVNANKNSSDPKVRAKVAAVRAKLLEMRP